MEGTGLPLTPEEVTPEWLTDALRQGGALPAGRVTAVASKVIGDGVGLLGQVARLTLTTEPAGVAPATIVGKFPAVAPENREVCRQYGIYEREVGFYQRVAHTVPIRTPKVYAASYDPETGRYVLLLEDLREGRLGDQLAETTLDEAEAAVDAAAALHAAWWGRPELTGHTWMAEADAPVWMMVQDTYRASWPGFIERAGHRLSPYVRDVGERLADALPALRRRFAAGPQTVVHGDYRRDNLFFDVPDAPHGVAAIDWQLVMRGRGIYDVAYFLTQSVPPEFRRAHEAALVDRYLLQLAKHGVTGYSPSEAWADYRAVALYFFLSPVAWLSGDLDVSNERGLALATAFLDRSMSAIHDLQLGDVLDELERR
jgi:aminoglycoside/choline kinase family phosphotransferase